MSMDQPQTNSEDQDGSVECLYCQHTDVRQRDVDHIYQRGEKTQFLPSEKHPPYPWHILARHVHPAQTSQAALAGACPPHGGWLHPKRHSLWRVGIWKEIQRPPIAALKGRLQERHESTRHQRLGPCSRPHDVEKHSEPTPQVRGREAGERRSGKKGLQKGAQQLQQTRDHTQMRLLRQRLFLPHRFLQPQATLQQSNRHDNQGVLP